MGEPYITEPLEGPAQGLAGRLVRDPRRVPKLLDQSLVIDSNTLADIECLDLPW
jgi:hypothetical protein